MQGGFFTIALAGRLLLWLIEEEGVAKGSLVCGAAVIEFEGYTVCALVEEGNRVEETRVYHELHYFSVPHAIIDIVTKLLLYQDSFLSPLCFLYSSSRDIGLTLALCDPFLFSAHLFIFALRYCLLIVPTFVMHIVLILV